MANRFYLPLIGNFIFFLHTSPGWFHYSIKLTIAIAMKNNSFVSFGLCRSFLIDKRVFVFSGKSHLNPLPTKRAKKRPEDHVSCKKFYLGTEKYFIREGCAPRSKPLRFQIN